MVVKSIGKPSLCCISIELQEKGYKYRTMTRTQFRKLGITEGISQIINRTANNLIVIAHTIELCGKRGWNYRIGSGIIPLATLPEIEDYGLENILSHYLVYPRINEIRRLIQNYNIRLSMHPDQYVVLASENPSTVALSIKELEYHAKFMDVIGLSRSNWAPINIHMNCFKGNRDKIFKRFIKSYEQLSAGVRSRLTLENEDKLNSWSVQNLIKYFTCLPIAITYDNLHHKCNPDGLTSYEAMMKCMDSWPDDIRPLFHFSDSREGNNPRAHADYPTEWPAEYSQWYSRIDLDFEFKMKDLAISKFQESY